MIRSLTDNPIILLRCTIQSKYTLFICKISTIFYLIIYSFLEQFYKRNGEVNEPDNLQLRLAYIYSKDAFTTKTTIASQSFAAEPFTIVSSGFGNVNLTSESYRSVAQEFTYKTKKMRNNILFSVARLLDYPLLGISGRPENSEKALEIYTASYEFTYFYFDNDKFEFNLNYSNADAAFTDKKAEIVSSLFRNISTFDKFDVFNEFWIVAPAFSSEINVDYTLGVNYHVSKDFSVQVKGQNIFDNAVQRTYENGVNPLTNEVNRVDLSVVDRRFWLGMEYLF